MVHSFSFYMDIFSKSFVYNAYKNLWLKTIPPLKKVLELWWKLFSAIQIGFELQMLESTLGSYKTANANLLLFRFYIGPTSFLTVIQSLTIVTDNVIIPKSQKIKVELIIMSIIYTWWIFRLDFYRYFRIKMLNGDISMSIMDCRWFQKNWLLCISFHSSCLATGIVIIKAGRNTFLSQKFCEAYRTEFSTEKISGGRRRSAPTPTTSTDLKAIKWSLKQRHHNQGMCQRQYMSDVKKYKMKWTVLGIIPQSI